MALAHSPGIITNGLVFAYDMSNTKKSWKGRPVTNQFAIPTPDADGYVGFQVNGTGTFRRIFSGRYGGYDIGPNDIVYRYDLGATGCHYHGNDVTINAGQTATWSFDYYVDPSVTGYPSTNYLANFEGVIGGAAGDPTPTQIGVWKRITFTGTAGSTGLCRMLLYPGACGDRLATGGFILFKNPQVEFDAPGNNPTPFVAVTRYANNNLESTPSYPTWNQSAASASGGTLTFTNGSYTTKGTWDLYKQYTGLSTGTNYTWSALVKLGTATNFLVTMNNAADWNTGPSSNFTNLTTNEFRRVSITGTTSTGNFNIHLGSSYNTELANTVQTGGTIYIQDVRLELKGSQSALNDLTGQNTINVNSLTYSSDGTFSFNGSGDRITSSTSLFDRTNGQEITVSCWINPSRLGGQYSVFCTNRSNDTSVYNWIFYQHTNDGAISFHGSAQNKSTYIPSVGTWINVTNTVTSAGVSTLYVNGVSTYVVNGYTYGSIPSLLGVGANPGGQEPFQGKISNVQIYNRALSAAEVKQNFNALRGRYGI